MTAWFFRIGEFSLINAAVSEGMRKRLPEFEWREVDVERDIVGADRMLRLRATSEAFVRYGSRIVRFRQPPRDFFPRIPSVIRAVRSWVSRNVDPSDTAFVFQTQSLFDARHPGCPHFLYTDHTYLANLRYPTPKPLLPVSKKWTEMERALYRDAKCTFVSSRFAEQSVRGDYGIPDSNVECVHSGSNVRAVTPGERGGNRILFVGVDWERKGGPELVRAFRKVRDTFPSAELWIAGCAPPLNEPGIHILGRVSAERVSECYAESDIFCLPSRMDPSASVLAEAALAELPVVATPVGGNVERVVDGETGFLCESDDLAGALCRLFESAELRQRLGANGKTLALEKFTWDAVCDRMAQRILSEL